MPAASAPCSLSTGTSGSRGGPLPAGPAAGPGPPGPGPARHLPRARRAGARRPRAAAGDPGQAPPAAHPRTPSSGLGARERGPRRRPLPGRRLPAARPGQPARGLVPGRGRPEAHAAPATASSRPPRWRCCAWPPRARPPPRPSDRAATARGPPPPSRRLPGRPAGSGRSPDHSTLFTGRTTMRALFSIAFSVFIALAGARPLRAEVRVVATVPDLAALAREVGGQPGDRPFTVAAHPGPPLRRRQAQPGPRAQPGRPAAAGRAWTWRSAGCRRCWWGPATAIQPGAGATSTARSS